ncbi:MAG: c-type cytochrome [Bryobacteraceae bacterium]
MKPYIARAAAGFALATALAQEKPVGDAALGKRLYESQCALCHGMDGAGGRGPSLNRARLKHAADEEGLRNVIQNGVRGTEMPGAWQLTPREVASVAVFVRSLATRPVEVVPGNPLRGADIYQAKGCHACHAIQGSGAGYGPELSEIGARRSGAYLREAIVNPGAAAPDYFLFVEAVTADGRRIRGIRVNEDSFNIQLKDDRREFHSFRKDRLKELKKLTGESPMPAYATLPPADLDDLVAYLASLKGKS